MTPSLEYTNSPAVSNSSGLESGEIVLTGTHLEEAMSSGLQDALVVWSGLSRQVRRMVPERKALEEWADCAEDTSAAPPR